MVNERIMNMAGVIFIFFYNVVNNVFFPSVQIYMIFIKCQYCAQILGVTIASNYLPSV